MCLSYEGVGSGNWSRTDVHKKLLGHRCLVGDLGGLQNTQDTDLKVVGEQLLGNFQHSLMFLIYLFRSPLPHSPCSHLLSL